MKKRIVCSLFVIGMAGFVFAFGDLLIPQENVLFEATKRPFEFSQLVTSSDYQVWAFRGFAGIIMEMIGTIGLYLYLQKSKAERIAFWGLLMTICHHILGAGVFALAYFLFPALGQMFLDGHHDAIAYASLEGPLGVFFILSMVSTLLGLGLMAVAVYRSSMLPKWSGWMAFAGFALIPLPGVLLQFMANVIWGVAYLWMAVHILKANKKIYRQQKVAMPTMESISN